MQYIQRTGVSKLQKQVEVAVKKYIDSYDTLTFFAMKHSVMHIICSTPKVIKLPLP